MKKDEKEKEDLNTQESHEERGERKRGFKHSRIP